MGNSRKFNVSFKKYVKIDTLYAFLQYFSIVV